MEDFNVTQLDATKWPVVGGIYRNNTIPGSIRVTAIVPSSDGRVEFDRVYGQFIHLDGEMGSYLDAYRVSIQDCYHPTDQGPIPAMRKVILDLIAELEAATAGMYTQPCIVKARALLAGLDTNAL